LATVGALRVPVRPCMPLEVARGLSVKARFSAWQVAQLTALVELKRVSWNSFLPRSIFADVCGLPGGMGAGEAPGARPCR
jgi:hypothetical protein